MKDDNGGRENTEGVLYLAMGFTAKALGQVL